MNNAFKPISTLTTIKLTCRCRNVVVVQEITEKKAKNKAVLPNTPTVGFPFPIYSQKLSCRLETAVYQGGRSRSRVSAKWPTRLLFTVYFTYTSKEQTYFEKHVASLVSLLLSTQLDKGYQKMDPSPPFPNI